MEPVSENRQSLKETEPSELTWELVPFDFRRLGDEIRWYLSLMRFRIAVKDVLRAGSPAAVDGGQDVPEVTGPVDSCEGRYRRYRSGFRF